MEYNWKVWGKFGLLYGAVVGLLVVIEPFGLAIHNINNGVVFSTVVSLSGVNSVIQDNIISIITALVTLIPILSILGAISLIVNTAILHYAGAHVSGYNSLLLLSIFIPVFGVAVNGLLSSIIPSFPIIIDQNPIIAIILGFFMTWISISLAYLIWTEGFKQPASVLSY